jgi:hypothetical protein
MVQANGDTIACSETEALVSVLCAGGGAPTVTDGRNAKCPAATGVTGLCMRQ